MRTTVRLGAALLLAPALILGAAACASQSGSETPARASAVATPTSEQVALVAIKAAPHVGDAVTAAQAEALRYFSKTHSAYQLLSGRWIILDRAKPVPATVQRDMNARAAKLLRKNRGLNVGDHSANGASLTIKYLQSDDSAQRIVVPLVHGSSSVPNSFPAAYHLVWVLNGPWGNGYQVASEADGLARAHAYIAKQKQPWNYVVVVAK